MYGKVVNVPHPGAGIHTFFLKSDITRVPDLFSHCYQNPIKFEQILVKNSSQSRNNYGIQILLTEIINVNLCF